MIGRARRLLRDERGGAAAEFAITLPAVILVLAAAVSVLHAQSLRVVLQDATADAARLVARGDAPDRAASLVEAAVAGAQLDLNLDGDLVCAEATAPWTVALDLTMELRARSCALGGGW